MHSSDSAIILERLMYYLDDLSDFNITFEGMNVIIEAINMLKPAVLSIDSAMASLGYIRQ